MLCDPNWRGEGASSHQMIHQTLEEDDICLPVFEDFLRYLYACAIRITADNVLLLSRLADKYMVSELQTHFH